ncbi:hypothetical protein CTAYLR_005443 [Chrysophaeum taylorii]|uniref:Tryptophan synthase beta chain-like PALP domain-containing protein n=1 Tax=Chrysophaeum taylorii TaxID=2483200 RepID=A0AAD7UJP3_9STRA|nr:hypothetical protein CTAYLR_005443 [Chrysophaeum taylorii]
MMDRGLYALASAVTLGMVAAAVRLVVRKTPRICRQRRPPTPLPKDYGVSAMKVANAAQRIAPFVHRTPIHTCRALDEMCGRHAFFKCEVLQRTGSFKIRGATNAALVAGAETLVTHSSGNHAQALALAARSVGAKAHIVMPRTAPAVKKAAVAGYGGLIELCEPTNEARAAAAAALCERVGGHFVHPSNDLDVIAGQGTVACELLADLPDLDALVVPVGGGGLVSGMAVYAKSFNPRIAVVGAEPKRVDDAARSKAAGRLIDCHDDPAPSTIADGLKTLLDSNTWPVVRDLVDEIITVDEADIAQATHLVWTRMKLCIEPSAGVGVAVLLSDAFKRHFPPDKYPRVGVILCGGNTDLEKAAKTFLAPTPPPAG